MIPLRYIRHLLDTWASWRNRQKRYRVFPKLRQLDRELAEARRSKRAGAARIIKAKQQVLHSALKGGA